VFLPDLGAGRIARQKDKAVARPHELEAASKLARDWEVDGCKEIPTVEEAAERFVADLESRGPVPRYRQKVPAPYG